jgi:hypothetical protein
MDSLLFQHPDVIWALPAAAILLAGWRALRRPFFAAIGITSLLRAPVHHASGVRRAPLLPALAAVALIVFALMDPVVPYSEA